MTKFQPPDANLPRKRERTTTKALWTVGTCCPCGVKGGAGGGGGGGAKAGLPLICLVPRETAPAPQRAGRGGGGPHLRPPAHSSSAGGFQLLDDEYIKKNFKLPPRAQYLDPFRRPLITFPMTQEGAGANFNMARKTKINQQILDGFLDASEAISAPSVFPYADKRTDGKTAAEMEQETIYILQLPDWEYECPIHHTVVKTPRFIWHSCKKGGEGKKGELKRGGGPLNKPKPWLLSRHTDFDLLSQW